MPNVDSHPEFRITSELGRIYICNHERFVSQAAAEIRRAELISDKLGHIPKYLQEIIPILDEQD